MKKELNLGKDKIGSLLLAFSVPCIISMLINSIYNIVDQIFIGQGVGYLGNAATNVIFPIVIFCNAVAGLIGNGCAANLSLRLGEKEDFLKVSIEKPEDKILAYIEKDIIKGETQFTQMLKDTILDSFERLIEPSIDREIRSDLTEKAEDKAIKVFGKNAKQLF